MNNTKTTKRALLSSVMAMLICVAMLIGTTFAWFTDSASTAVNKIQAGTLEVGLEMKQGDTWVNAEGETLGWVAEDGREQNEIFWEPGCTYKLPTLKITNKGNLALQFKVLVNGISGDMDLLNALEFSYSYAWYNEGSVVDSGSFEGSNLNHLPYEIPYNLENFDHIGATEYNWRGYPLNVGTFTLAGTNMGFYTLQAHMKESAGNEYQGKALEDLSITIVATQVAGVETDSFNDIYDKDAEYPEVVATAADFEAALDNPDVTEIIVASDITFDWGGNSYGNSNALKMQDKVISGATGNEVVTFKGYGSANTIKDVTISNINVVDETVGDSTGWEHAYLEFENLTATDVKFVNAPQLNGTCILTNCTFTGTADKYAAWINSGNITLKNCMCNGIRSLKIHEAYGSDVVSVVVDGCTFNTTGKPGVVIGDLDATTSITIKNSTFNNCHAGDQNKYIYESDTDVTTFNFTEIGNTVNNG